MEKSPSMSPAGQGQQQKPMSGQCDLSNAPINLNAFRESAKKEMADILAVEGKRGKVMILDPKLAGPLGLVIEIGLLKSLGVEKLYYLSPGQLSIPPEAEHVVYLVRPEVTYMKWIADQVKGFLDRKEVKTIHVYFVPRRTIMCERVLEEEGVYNQLKIGEYHLDLIPFDKDVLSLELSSSFRQCFLDGDRTSLFYVARSLMKLQSIFGMIPHIKGKGIAAQHVAQMMLRMRNEMRASEAQVDTPAIAQLILIDRSADLVTPMPTMLTYEGLVDEYFGIQNSFVDLPSHVVAEKKDPAQPADKRVKTPLNSNDKIFRDVRDLNFSVVGPILNQKAKLIDEYYKERYKAETASQLREFISKFTLFQQEHSFLRIHTSIAEQLLAETTNVAFGTQLEAEQNLLACSDTDMSISYIEECINKQDPLVKVLRLLCLFSLTQGGLKDKIFTFFTKEIVQTYGYEYMFTLSNLSKLGLLRRQEGKNFYEAARETMRLTVNDVDERDPNDISYVYSGYAPLSVRMFEHAWKAGVPYAAGGSDDMLRDGWGLPRPSEEAVRSIPGPTFHAFQATKSAGVVEEIESATSKTSQVTLVFFVGGVTFAEISALRFLSSRMDGRDIIVGATSIINGNTFLESLYEEFGPQYAPAPSSNNERLPSSGN